MISEWLHSLVDYSTLRCSNWHIKSHNFGHFTRIILDHSQYRCVQRFSCLKIHFVIDWAVAFLCWRFSPHSEIIFYCQWKVASSDPPFSVSLFSSHTFHISFFDQSVALWSFHILQRVFLYYFAFYIMYFLSSQFSVMVWFIILYLRHF